jgi:hypothetical protein
MTFRKLLVLGGLGGFLYAHRKRGGEWTLDSFKDTGRELLGSARTRADELRTKAEGKIHEVVGQVKEDIKGRHEVGDVSGVEQGGKFADDVTGYGSSGYGYNRR